MASTSKTVQLARTLVFRTLTAFISGPLEPTPAYFAQHYAPRIDIAIAQSHSFIVGPSRGTDTIALSYLKEHGVPPSRVTLFLNESEGAQPKWQQVADSLRVRGAGVVVVGRGNTERDAAMTAASDYDILRYHTEAECRALYGNKYRPRVSGTQRNELRRKEMQEARSLPLPKPVDPPQFPNRPRTVFISGPLTPTTTYFAEHYAARVDAAIDQGHSFVLGPSAGIDTIALAYLKHRGVSPSRITVFLSESEGELPQWQKFRTVLLSYGLGVVVAGRGHTERDAAMTVASDYDILRYQTEAECRAMYGSKYRARVSGTQLNEIRRSKAKEGLNSQNASVATGRKWENRSVPKERSNGRYRREPQGQNPSRPSQ
jgi:hypothetical protein